MSGPRTRPLAAVAPDPPPEADLLPGTAIGPFVVEEVIAAGGFGTVVRARSGDLSAPVAVKVLHGELSATDDAAARFAREIDILSGVHHPGIVEVMASGRMGDGRPYFAMELLAGADLERRLADGPMAPPAVAATVTDIAAALEAAHARGIVHRDVKASNVFVCDGGRVCLLDFGIAKLAPGTASLTRSRQALGTPSAMAPEQLAGDAVDARTDVYALGALAFHMLTGRPPFAGEPATIVGHLHRYAERPRPSAAVPLPAAVDAVIVRAMSVRPADRYVGAADFARALAAAISPMAPEIVEAIAVKVAFAGPGDPSALLDDVDAGLDLVDGRLIAAGFSPILEASLSALYARPLAAGEDTAATDAAIAAIAAEVTGADMTFAVACGPAEARAGVIVGGPLIERLWALAPAPPDDG